MGDTIYKDTVVMDEKRAEYAKLAAVPEFARFRQRVPILATWDDHDYGQNDGGADYPKRDEAQQVFLGFFAPDALDDVRRKRAGLYDAHVFGPPGKRTQVILLDTRYFRSPLRRNEVLGGYLPNRDTSATMLGEAQWTWLADQLRRPADLRLICSSIPVLHEQQPNEKWDNLPHERARLFNVIAESKAGGVVLLSGDRHRGEMSAAKPGHTGVGYPLYELTSSGLNCPYEPYEEENRHRIADVLWTDNFGMIEVDWAAADPAVALQIRTGKGDRGIGHEVKLSELRPPR
jgi:alkaline phosphatase D